MNLIQLLQHIGDLLTKPSVFTTSPDRRRRARLHSSLMLTILFFFGVASIVAPDYERHMLMIMAACSLGLYFLSRSRYNSFSAVLSLLMITIFMVISFTNAPNYSEYRAISEMKWMCVPLLFGSLCLPYWFMFPYTVFTIIFMGFMPGLFGLNPEYRITEALVYTSVISMLGVIASAIMNRQQKQITREMEKSDKLLLNILPDEIAEELKEEGWVIPRKFEDVTILFGDIVGFTKLSSSMEPMNLVSLLNSIFTEFDRYTEKYQLEKIKTIGDSYMVAGGIPVVDKKSVYKVMSMACEMLEFMENNSDRLKGLKLRIGIATGSVVAGVIGEKKFIYDVWGDTVNIASRMESMGEAGRIQVTADTAKSLSDDYSFTDFIERELKGVGPFKCCFLKSRQ